LHRLHEAGVRDVTVFFPGDHQRPPGGAPGPRKTLSLAHVSSHSLVAQSEALPQASIRNGSYADVIKKPERNDRDVYARLPELIVR